MVLSVGYPWFALYVRSRFEKVVSQTLRNNGFTEYLPLYTKMSQWSDRTQKLELPLFPGYVFCRFDPKRTFSVLRLPSVLHVLSVGSKPAEIPDAEVETIRKLLASARSPSKSTAPAFAPCRPAICGPCLTFWATPPRG